jgi:asparagine synthase (glutamine-hydrolysing)
MCGLVGIASTVPSVERAWLPVARDTLTHRGPDDAGEWWSGDGRVGLAHRRLSIRDLSTLGQQPMHLPKAGLSIVFNGEIYNFSELRRELELCGYRFLSHSDTEVLLAAYAEWGAQCLSRLNGMFAFAIYDARRQSLFMARDRAGEKPLFYRLDSGTLFFASELKALLANTGLPRQIDRESMDCYLNMGYVPGDRCILRGYQKLPPAHALVFSTATGAAKRWRYWQLPELEDAAYFADETALLDELEPLLEDAVGRQLIADVPVGVLLSGGVDSSLITAMAVRRSSQVRTFTIGFPGHGKLDETQHARLVASHFGTRHTELMADPNCTEMLPALAWQFDEPIGDSSMLPTWLVSNLVRQHCAVALGGDGGDELFGGYGDYTRLLSQRLRLNLLPAWLRHVIAAAANGLPVGLKGRNYLQGLATDLRHSLPLHTSYFDARTRRRLLGLHADNPMAATAIFAERIPNQTDLLQRATRMDFENYLAEDILVKVDRASMLNSLEVRAPILDVRVIEFAFSKIPSRLKTTEKEKKILLKRLADRVLPANFDKQRKQGFSIPLTEWLTKGASRELFWDILTSGDCVFDGAVVRELLKGQDLGRSNADRLFSLAFFEMWRKQHKITW